MIIVDVIVKEKPTKRTAIQINQYTSNYWAVNNKSKCFVEIHFMDCT
jgi:hypothetical protein